MMINLHYKGVKMKKALTRMDVVVYALYKLGGVSKKIRTEDIAVEAYKLDNEKFGWQLPKYRKMKYPDKLTALIALETAHKLKYGRLVIGRAGRDASGKTDGWNLTPNGVNWIKQNKDRIINNLDQEHKTILISNLDKNRFIKRITNEPLYKLFMVDNEMKTATQYMFTDMLICSPDASKEIIKEKFERLLATALLMENAEIIDFLNKCKDKFKSLIE